MERYINDSLVTGIIRPFSSPVGTGFVFIGKKDGSLRSRIDFNGLNNITVKNKYPLPLLSFAFETLHGASLFTKLDMWNVYSQDSGRRQVEDCLSTPLSGTLST